eukprot:13578-Hanusia_phi.AAC.1
MSDGGLRDHRMDSDREEGTPPGRRDGGPGMEGWRDGGMEPGMAPVERWMEGGRAQPGTEPGDPTVDGPPFLT